MDKTKTDPVFLVKNQGEGDEGKGRYIYGPVLIPDRPDDLREDRQGSRVTDVEVTKAAHYFVGHLSTSPSDESCTKTLHEGEAAGIIIAESHVTDRDLDFVIHKGEPEEKTITMPKGTWMVGATVTDDDIWDRVEEGELTGWSIGARANKTYIKKSEEVIQKNEDASGDAPVLKGREQSHYLTNIKTTELSLVPWPCILEKDEIEEGQGILIRKLQEFEDVEDVKVDKFELDEGEELNDIMSKIRQEARLKIQRMPEFRDTWGFSVSKVFKDHLLMSVSWGDPLDVQFRVVRMDYTIEGGEVSIGTTKIMTLVLAEVGETQVDKNHEETQPDGVETPVVAENTMNVKLDVADMALTEVEVKKGQKIFHMTKGTPLVENRDGHLVCAEGYTLHGDGVVRETMVTKSEPDPLTDALTKAMADIGGGSILITSEGGTIKIEKQEAKPEPDATEDVSDPEGEENKADKIRKNETDQSASATTPQVSHSVEKDEAPVRPMTPSAAIFGRARRAAKAKE